MSEFTKKNPAGDRIYLTLIYKSFIMRKARYILPIIALIIGVSIATALLMVSLDMEDKIAMELRDYGPNLIAVPESEDIELTIGGMDIGSISETKYIPEASAIKFRELPLEVYEGKICVEPGVNAFVYSVVTVDDESDVLLAGTWFDELIFINAWWSITGEYPEDDSSVVLGKTAAEKLGKSVGDRILLEYAEAFSNETGTYEYNNSKVFRITGIVSTGGEDDSRIFANLDAVQNLTNKENKINILHISTLCNNCYPDDIAEIIEREVPGIDVLTVRQIASAERNTLDLIENLVGFISIIAGGTSVIAVMTTMTLSVMESRKEIGLMKAVGANNSTIGLLFFGEGCIIAVIGGLLGFGVGILISRLLGIYVFDSTIVVRWWIILVSFGVAFGTVVLASVVPIRKALKVDPVSVL